MAERTGAITSLPNSVWGPLAARRMSETQGMKPLYVVPPPVNLRVRKWDRVAVYTFMRPAGESIIRVPCVRLLTMRSRQKVTIRLNGGPAREYTLPAGAVTLCARDATTNTVGGEHQIVHIFHSPQVYHQAADEIGFAGTVDFDFIPDLNDPRIADLANLLAQEALRPGIAEHMLVDGLSHALAVAVLRRLAGGVAPQSGGLSSQRLDRVVEFIAAHIADSELSLHALATVACLSTYQFGRSFKQSTGLTPHQFVLERRLNLAKILLREGRLPLSEVASASGFADQAHFSHRFRESVGTTPRQYRLAAA